VNADTVQAVVERLTPALLDVVDTGRNFEKLRGDLSRLDNTFWVRRVGQEMNAMAVTQLRKIQPLVTKIEVTVKPEFLAEYNEEFMNVKLVSFRKKIAPRHDGVVHRAPK